MSPGTPAARPGFSRSAWVAGAVALALHGVWWYFLARSWTVSTTPWLTPVSPSVSLLPSSYVHSDPHHVGSPLLFALPSQLGFSGQSNPQVGGTPAALQAPPRRAVLLNRGSTSEAGFDFLRDLTQTVAATLSLPVTVPSVARTLTLPAGTTGFVVRVYWPDGSPAVRSGLPGAGVLAPLLQDRPWELGAMLIFDAQGGVRNVFVERTTTSRERTEAVVRALRDIRIEPTGQEERTRVVVHYDQDAGPRAPAGGVARP